jgi:hypothetical protein
MFLEQYGTRTRAVQSVQRQGYGLGDRGSIPGRGWELFSSPPGSDRFWGPPSLLSNGYGGGPLSPGVREREANHSPLSSVQVKNPWSYTSIPPNVFMAWYLVTHRNNFTFDLLQYGTFSIRFFFFQFPH